MISSNPDIIILDVRKLEEYNEEHLINAINMPYDEIEKSFSSEITDNLESIIVLYCKSGVRATTAAETLSKLGYTNVYTFGGINDWKYDTVSENNN